MCKADSSLVFCGGYGDAAKKAAALVESSGTPGDKDAQPQTEPVGTPKKSSAGAASASMAALALAAVVAMLAM